MGFLPPLFPPGLLGQLRRSSRLGLWPSTPPASPSPHSARSLSPPPPLRRASLLPRCQPSLGRGLRRGGQTKGPGQTRGHPTAAPHHVAPFLRARVQLPLPLSSQRSGGVRPTSPLPPAPSFPRLVRANRSAAGAEPPGFLNTKECTGRGWGRCSEDGGSSLSPQAGERTD